MRYRLKLLIPESLIPELEKPLKIIKNSSETANCMIAAQNCPMSTERVILIESDSSSEIKEIMRELVSILNKNTDELRDCELYTFENPRNIHPAEFLGTENPKTEDSREFSLDRPRCKRIIRFLLPEGEISKFMGRKGEHMIKWRERFGIRIGILNGLLFYLND